MRSSLWANCQDISETNCLSSWLFAFWSLLISQSQRLFSFLFGINHSMLDHVSGVDSLFRLFHVQSICLCLPGIHPGIRVGFFNGQIHPRIRKNFSNRLPQTSNLCQTSGVPNIFRLQVTVHDTPSMQVLDALGGEPPPWDVGDRAVVTGTPKW